MRERTRGAKIFDIALTLFILAIVVAILLIQTGCAGTSDWRKATIIHQEAKGKFTYISDIKQHGVGDIWEIPVGVPDYVIGDCEEFAMLSRALLEESGEVGIDIYLVQDSPDTYHAVAVWNNLVFDNRRNDVVPRDYTSYRWIRNINHRAAQGGVR